MATETTRLLDSCVFISLQMEQDNGNYLTESDKTKGLSLEELMPFENDPWWQNLRKTFFLSYWITVTVVFIAACTLSILGHNNNSCNLPIISTINYKNNNYSRQIQLTKEILKGSVTSRNIIINNIISKTITTTEQIINNNNQTIKLQ